MKLMNNFQIRKEMQTLLQTTKQDKLRCYKETKETYLRGVEERES